MQNTKLGISAGLIGAVLFLMGLVEGYIPLLLIAGYVLIAEDNVWLKRTSVKAIVVTFLFSILYILIDLLPDFLDLINDFMALFDESLSNKAFEILRELITFFRSSVSLLKVVFFILLIIKALKNATIIIPPIDNFVNKHIN